MRRQLLRPKAPACCCCTGSAASRPEAAQGRLALVRGHERLEQRHGQRSQLLALAHVRAAREVVVVVRLNGVQDLSVQDERGPHGPARLDVQVVNALLRLLKVLARARNLELHELAPALVHDALGGHVQLAAQQLCLADAKLRQVLQRHVDAVALADVLTNVTQDVGQLVGGAQRQRGAVHLVHGPLVGGVYPHDWHGHEPHGARHAVAVLV
mmetsp:Transcript_27494/g.69968  ORF Transcript_27494/g.69968 Transcript_27494/m.69968 type:complete len:212 (-) Transcript_27494:837-1472(-)